jgi:hypothetical protein
MPYVSTPWAQAFERPSKGLYKAFSRSLKDLQKALQRPFKFLLRSFLKGPRSALVRGFLKSFKRPSKGAQVPGLF